ncbi:MAG: hypothetical protein M3076_07360 [Actinomycetota bacterium]|nr:hypothetical protein [Actinomycetota bacterium]
MRKVILAAVEAALEDVIPSPEEKKRHRLPAKRAILIGAGLMAAGRVAVKGRRLMGTMSDRLGDIRDRVAPDDDDLDPDELDEEEHEVEDAVEDADYEGEDEDEPEDEEHPTDEGEPEERLSSTRGRESGHPPRSAG